MNGLSLRLNRLFEKKQLFLAALDHGQYCGVLPGFESIVNLVESCDSYPVDGLILNPGIVPVLKHFPNKKLLVLRVTHAGSQLSGTAWDHKYFLPPQNALELGADAVIAMCILGHSKDPESLQELTKVIRDYHQFGIPVIAEMLPFDPKLNSSHEAIANISRIGAEIGADIIKTYYTEKFDHVTSTCPVPVIMAGGEKKEALINQIKHAIECGSKGVAIGRNLFQSSDTYALIREIYEVVKKSNETG